ncbi:hypothetical protein GLOIN_2v1881853 [Rhizophagus clarus]|uniref:Uncharacterized protein n=1 Tax=Rhizophagus clarus TaxID=94130 RepID=A0A8H3KUN9_9GLOM|nr:hypothetical protein GLOIN_2v1881853 [Rhizophagus clarus]
MVFNLQNHEDIKTRLNEYKINDNSLFSNTLFNYPRFLKYLNTCEIFYSVTKWFNNTFNTSKRGNRGFLRDSDTCSVSNFRKIIYTSLFKIFNENEINLHTFEIDVSNSDYNDYYTYYDNIFELILQNTNFIRNTRYLNLYIDDSSEKYDEDDADRDRYKLFKDRILQIIDLHQNLKKLLLDYGNLPLYQSLLLSKDSNFSNTLNTIILFCIDSKDMVNLAKTFEQLNVLESIHIIYCFLNCDFIQQIINLTKPFKLKSLCMRKIPNIEFLSLLLQKSGNYLENFEFNFRDTNSSLLLKQQLVELIIEYCKNIKLLDLFILENQVTIYLIFKLIENFKQSLEYLSIYLQDRNTKSESSTIILQNLGHFLPPKLEYLNLNLYFVNTNDFEIFLKNSQDTFIKKLLICNIRGQNILPSIKEYIMKKKMVKYLAAYITISSYGNYGNKYICSDLTSSVNEVNEFRLKFKSD